MADWAKRARKALQGELPPGENVITAALLQPDGMMSATMARGSGGPIGSLVHRWRHPKPVDDVVDDDGLAVTLGDEPFYAVLTQQRLLCMPQAFSGRPKGMRTIIDRHDIVAFEVTPESLADRVIIRFSDGSGRRLEAPGRAARTLRDALDL